MKPIYIFKGILIICVVGLAYVVVDLIEFDTNHTPARVLPECEGEKKAGCHFSLYEAMEKKHED